MNIAATLSSPLGEIHIMQAEAVDLRSAVIRSDPQWRFWMKLHQLPL